MINGFYVTRKLYCKKPLLNSIFVKTKAGIVLCNPLCAICNFCNVNSVIIAVLKKGYIDRYKNFIVSNVAGTSKQAIHTNDVQQG